MARLPLAALNSVGSWGLQARDWGNSFKRLNVSLAQITQCYSTASSHNPPTLFLWKLAQTSVVLHSERVPAFHGLDARPIGMSTQLSCCACSQRPLA